MAKRINVTKTHLPSLEEYQSLVEEIWESGQLTNYGEKATLLQNNLKSHLGVKHLQLASNGTIAIQIAIKALELKGEIITTPFSYVATVSSIVWEGCEPVFVDIRASDYCIDPDKIEAAITDRTSAILATHVYGNPCAVEQIQEIAIKHNLKVIYDAAHAFDVKINERSVLTYGDISTLSFHATKVFHSGEGGAIITQNEELAHRISYLGNFGHNGPEDFYGLGVNGKVSEFHAALGLCVLPLMSTIIGNRRNTVKLYDSLLLHESRIARMTTATNVTHNCSYYPILLQSEQVLLKVKGALNEANIFPRRYFYPSLNRLPYLHNPVKMPVAESVSERILCLPLSSDQDKDDTTKICSIILENL